VLVGAGAFTRAALSRVTPSPARGAAAALFLVVGLALAGATPASRSADPRGPRLLVAAAGRLVVASPGGTATRLAGQGFKAWASFRPDGTLLLASSTRAGFGSPAGRLALVTENADGTGIRPVTSARSGEEAEGRWSPSGLWIAYTRRDAEGSGDIELVSPASGTPVPVVATPANERQPAWAPNGRWLAYVSDAGGSNDVYLHSLRTGHDSALTSDPGSETAPLFSPAGSAVVFVSDAAGTSDLVLLTLADATRRALTADPGQELAPAWSPDGSEVGFVAIAPDGTRTLKAVRVADGAVRVLAPAPAGTTGFDWRVVRLGKELLPDMAQLVPANLVVTSAGNGGRIRFRLGFDSTVANVGRGQLEVHGARPRRGVPTMRAAQIVKLAGGGTRSFRDIGFMRYFTSAEHNHWHFLTYERYELRRTRDNALIVRDHKAGFCFRDNPARRVARHLPGEPAAAVFVDSCRKNDPRALSVTTGSSIGSLDWYPAFFHGQYVDVTGVPAGRYVLVHRVNFRWSLREVSYGNNAASVAIRLSWPHGRSSPPAVQLLRRCPGRDRC
jgi:Tol biopolymer transport system component